MAYHDSFKVKWDEVGKRLYEIGVDHGMLYLQKGDGTYDNGVAWSGLSQVSQNPEGADVNDIWADNMKYLSLRAAETFGATIECYSYPDEFKACNGEAEIAPGVTIGQQTRKAFGFSYRSQIGNDTEFQDHGFKIHIIYNATASPSEKSYGTINDSTDVDAMSFEVDTTSIPVAGFKPTSCLEVDSTKVSEAQMNTLLDLLYGTDNTDPTLPSPEEVLAIFGGTVVPSIELNSHYLPLTVGGTSKLVATVKNSTETADFDSSSDSVATVAADGTVEAIGAGSAIITAAITVDGVTYNDTCTVVVTAANQG